MDLELEGLEGRQHLLWYLFILDIPDTDQTNLRNPFYCSLSRALSCTGARQPMFDFKVLEYPSINKDHQTGLQVGLGHFCNLLGISHTSI